MCYGIVGLCCAAGVVITAVETVLVLGFFAVKYPVLILVPVALVAAWFLGPHLMDELGQPEPSAQRSGASRTEPSGR